MNLNWHVLLLSGVGDREAQSMIQRDLIETEHSFTSADRRWRTEVGRSFGADAVLLYGHLPQARGEPETTMRRAFDARQEAMTAWRQARRLLPIQRVR
jgi:hypothetical protein